MESKVGGCVLLPLVLFLVTPILPSSASDEAPWRNILKYPVFSRFIDRLSNKGAPLDVGVPSSCFTDHAGIHDDISVFLEGLTSTFRLFTTSRGFLPRCPILLLTLQRSLQGPSARFAARNGLLSATACSASTNHHVVIFSDEFYLKDTGVQKYLLRKKMTGVIQQGAGYNFFSRTPFNQKVRSDFGRSSVVHTFTALLLQQSYRLPATIRNRTPAQLVVGLWALLAVVVGTAFRGSLTSLLRQIPLEGSPLEFTNERDIVEQGYRFCRLTYQGDEIQLDFTRLTPVKRTRRICITEENEVKYMKAARAVFLLHEPCVKKDEGYIEQLYKNDYAPLPKKLSPYLAGPSIRANSRYRDAVKNAITQAFECGLFQRQLLLDDFVRNYKACTSDAI
ncbi:hypothetical protein HPB48_010510 [Haemaphysalis longicornis]|uniref:Uncharacterized protein n=1 Tax=Haemaphysalis longicornis TaxID=44386 RepID=A0A9J6G9M1_HAELO|nr:hypothetical protein HPB48_010510 [Haemaphysalis longicornis]